MLSVNFCPVAYHPVVWGYNTVAATHMLLQPDIRLVERPAYPLQIRAHVEQVRGVRVKDGEYTLFADRDAQIWHKSAVFHARR